ncbi:MAG: heme exporter protein CcmD [Betaproteobacteria bacterium]|nr:heme exporter protein CcmD [Betaproteobacteria bacterium]
MYWNSFSDFLAMGGYAFYVWGSFLVTALVMTAEPLLLRRRRQQLIARLKRQLDAENRAGQGVMTPETGEHP